MWQDNNKSLFQFVSDNVMSDINKCIDAIPTKSMEDSVRPLLNQVVALLRHRGCTPCPLPVKAVTTDHTIHVVSKAVTKFIRTGREAASEHQTLKDELDEACDVALSAGESLCRILTQQTTHGMSPSSSQTGTDSGVEDIDDESGSELFHILSKETDISNPRSWLQSDRDNKGPDVVTRPLTEGLGLFCRDDTRSTRSHSDDDIKRSELTSACLGLVTSVVGVLTLADRALIDEIMTSVAKVSDSLGELQGSKDFRKFMQEFSEFGSRMIRLAHITGARQKDLRSDVERAHMEASRHVLEKGTLLLLATSKVCYQHPLSCLARSSRDHCFERMRIALRRILQVVKSSTGGQQGRLAEVHTIPLHSNDIVGLETTLVRCTLERQSNQSRQEKITLFEILGTLQEAAALQQDSNVCNYDVTNGNADQKATKMEKIARKISDRVQDFTDSAYTSNDQRSRILKANIAMRAALNPVSDLRNKRTSVNESMRAMQETLRRTVLIQMNEITKKLVNADGRPLVGGNLLDDLVESPKHKIGEKAGETLARFRELSKQASESFYLARQCLTDEAQKVATNHVIENMNDITQQVVTSFHIVQSLTDSPIATENLRTFVQQWQAYLTSEIDILISTITTPQAQDQTTISSTLIRSRAPDSQAQKSIPASSEQTAIVRLGLEVKLLSSQCRVEHAHWESLPRTDHTDVLLRNVKKIYLASWDAFNFTRGEPPLDTTADFFDCTAEIFTSAEELSRFARIYLEEHETASRFAKLHTEATSATMLLPTSCLRLQTTFRMTAHGKSAVFHKVMMTLQEVKNVLELVSKLTILMHSIVLEMTILPSIPENQQFSSNPTTTRHRNMATRFKHKNEPITSMNRIRSASRDRMRGQTKIFQPMKSSQSDNAPPTNYNRIRSSSKSKHATPSQSGKPAKKFTACGIPFTTR